MLHNDFKASMISKRISIIVIRIYFILSSSNNKLNQIDFEKKNSSVYQINSLLSV